MTKESNGDNFGQERTNTFREGVADGYQRRFAESPALADAARRRAQKAASELKVGLQHFGYPLNLLNNGFEEHGDTLTRLLSWGAFDYSVALPDGNVEVVGSDVLQVPPGVGLHTRDFAGMIEFVEESILAMRLYRNMTGLGPVINPNLEFLDDFGMVSGLSGEPPLPPQTP